MNDNRNEVDESLGLFEAALRAGKLTLELPRPRAIAALLDGSDQDPTVLALAEALAARSGVALTRVDPPAAGADALVVLEHLRAAARSNDLLVLPVPFGEDIGSLKNESLSSVVDLALAEIQRPMVLVRRAVKDPRALIARPLVLLEWHENLQFAATGWAALLASSGGSVALMAGHDPELLDEIRAIFDDHADDLAAFESMLERAATRLSGGLVSALQKLGSERHFAVTFENIGAADLAARVRGRAAEEERLIVAACLRGATGSTVHRVRDLILGSDLPLLVITC